VASKVRAAQVNQKKNGKYVRSLEPVEWGENEPLVRRLNSGLHQGRTGQTRDVLQGNGCQG